MKTFVVKAQKYVIYRFYGDFSPDQICTSMCTSVTKMLRIKIMWNPHLSSGICAVLCVVLMCSSSTYAQSTYNQAPSTQGTDNLVRAKLRQVALGNGAAVRAEVPELLKSYPNDAGVQFLNATLLTDGNKALPLFVRIVRESPQSIWADDAEWRVVQIYALRKDTANARSELQNFRKKYPTSEFLLFAAEIVKSTVGLPPSFGATRPSIVVASTTPNERPAIVNSGGSTTDKAVSSTSKPAPKVESKPESKIEPKIEQKPEPKIEPKTEAAPEASATSAEGVKFTLQVGLYATKASANEEVERFRKARMKANIVEKNLEGTAKYAVTVGNYSSRDAADKAKGTVQKICNCVPFVITK
jgi:cell division septation protein DedD